MHADVTPSVYTVVVDQGDAYRNDDSATQCDTNQEINSSEDNTNHKLKTCWYLYKQLVNMYDEHIETDKQLQRAYIKTILATK